VTAAVPLLAVAVVGVRAPIPATAPPTRAHVERLVAEAERTTSAATAHQAAQLLRTHFLRDDADGTAHAALARAVAVAGRADSAAGRRRIADRAFAEAVDAARAAVERAPHSASHHATLGDAYGQRAAIGSTVDRIRFGRRAVASYQRARDLDPTCAPAHVGLAIAKLETPPLFGGDPDEALRLLRRAQRLDPALVDAWLWEGIALARRDQIGAARRAFARALELEPRNVRARNEIAILDRGADRR
jgi:tetratricopeptide (TPR) repeat protein